MRNVYQAEIVPEAVHIRDMLAEAGIDAQLVQGDLEGWAPDRGASSPAQVWVSDSDEHRARELIERHRKSRESSGQTSWRCRGCREPNPAEFDLCWSCGTERTS